MAERLTQEQIDERLESNTKDISFQPEPESREDTTRPDPATDETSRTEERADDEQSASGAVQKEVVTDAEEESSAGTEDGGIDDLLFEDEPVDEVEAGDGDAASGDDREDKPDETIASTESPSRF